jgi:hypothetical protein
MRLPGALAFSIKDWAKKREMNRSAAFRLLLDLGLKSERGAQSQASRLRLQANSNRYFDRSLARARSSFTPSEQAAPTRASIHQKTLA